MTSALQNSDPEIWAPVGGASAVLVGVDPKTANSNNQPGSSGPVMSNEMSNPAIVGAWVGSQERFPWASVTKLVTTLACLIAVEESSVRLDDPIEGYKNVTLAHLLSHAAGIAFDTPTMAIEPQTKRLYSNAGIRIAADHVAHSTGMTFRDYVHDGVLRPLRLNNLLWADPASGAFGTIDDLAKFAAELLLPTLISPATLGAATTPQWPHLDGIVPGFGRQSPCPWGLGFEIKGKKSPHWMGTSLSPQAFGHFGQSGSLIAVDRARQTAWCSLSPAPFGPWALQAWPAFLDAPVFDIESVLKA